MACGVKLSVCSKVVAFILCLLVSGSFSGVQAQKQSYIWYFGEKAGLDFNSGVPVALTNSAMSAAEGTASIADTQGQLLFYTDGITVWNKQHQQMLNGNGLATNGSSSQGAHIVPKPGSTTIYYVFTTDSNGGIKGLRYSTIDITKDGGLGGVTEKNKLLYTPTTEKMTAVRHANGRDVWVLTHEYGTDAFKAHLVTANGVTETAVNSNIGKVYPKETGGVNAIGGMKISPDGKKLAISLGITNFDSHKIELLDFNSTTGIVSNPQVLTTGFAPYSMEFSPDNSKLYVTIEGGKKLVQFDLAAVAIPIQNTLTTIGSLTQEDALTPYTGGTLQLGPDGKLYIAKPWSKYLGIVHNPNAKGAACNLVDNGIYLEGRYSMTDLPAFIQSDFYFTNDVKFTINCFGTASIFNFGASPLDQPTFMEWNFGDPASGANNTAKTLNATHNFSAPGEYTVTFIRHIANKQETYTIGIKITAPPIVDLGPDRWVCPGTEVTLDATTTNATYKWSNGSTSASITTTTPGTYWVDVTEAECTTRDEVKISNYTLPTVNLGADRELCEGETLELNAFNQGATYKWQDGSTNPTFTVTKAGTYSLEVTSANGCTKTDEVTILYNPLPIVNLGPDRDICANTTITLDATQPGMTYKWHNGSTAPTFTVTEPGEYWVTLTSSKGCSATDIIRINHLPIPVVNLGPDETLCSGDTKLLNATYPNSTYLWQDGSTNPTFLITEAGRYWVDVTNEFGCVVRDEIWVPYLTRPAIALGNDTTLCYGDTLVIGTELPGGIRYEWQDGSTEALYKVTKPGTYKLKAYNQHCEASDEITVKFKDCIGGLFIPNIITPNADGLNDVFFIHGLKEDDWELVMFNRWGKEVYRTRNYKNDWVPQPIITGMFYYLLQHPTTGRTYKGWLEVLQ